MMEVRINIPLAPDLRGRIFAATGVAAPEEWVVGVDPRQLDPVEREHLLRMAASDTMQWLSLYHDAPRGKPPTDVWVGEYVPDPDRAQVRRESRRLPLDASGDDAGVVAAALAACGAAGEGAEDAPSPSVAAAAAIRADRLRWEAAKETARRRLDAAIDEWIGAAEERAADLRARGAAALTPREIEHGAAVAPRPPLWFNAVVAADARSARLKAAWNALDAAWNEASAQVVAERDARKRAEEETARAEQERRRQEMVAWITAHGSDRLRTLLANDYPVWRAYVRERTAREFPGFAPDLDGRVIWRDLRDDDDDLPTDDQIALARRVGGRAVMIVRDARGRRCEVVAVVVERGVHDVTLVEAAVDADDDDDEE